MSFFHPDVQEEEEFNYSYLDIQQIWLILKNGLCLGHWYFSGQSLESNLFAAFVSALFSFSKDMSSGGTSNIRNMSFSELDIYYLPGRDEKFFTAIAVNRGVEADKIMKYLEYIARKFEQSFNKFISEPSPLVPSNFKSFHKTILSYILINEHISTFKKPLSPEFKFSLDSRIKETKYSKSRLVILCEDEILRIFETNPISLFNCHFVDFGKIISWLITESNNLLILSHQDELYLTIDPLDHTEETKKEKILLPIDGAKWIIPETNSTDFFYVFSSNQYVKVNISKKELVTAKPVGIDILLKQIMYNDSLKLILLVSEDGKIYGIENIDSLHNLSPVPVIKEVIQIFKGPKDISYFYYQDNSIGLSNLTSNPLELKGNFSKLKSIVITPNDDAIIMVSENKLDIFNELGEILVRYPIQEGLTGMIEYNKREDQYYLVLVKKTGVIEFFKGLIERKRIREQQQAYSRKFDSILQKISRISTNTKKISDQLKKQEINSREIQNQMNLCKVYRQQLKNIVPTNLKNLETLPMIYQNKIKKFENNVSEIFSELESLNNTLIERYEDIKHKELQSLSSLDRILDYIAKMRPRESIPISDMANQLELNYENCLGILLDLDNKKQLTGSLREITKTSFIEKNYLFTKEDPELEKYSGRLSF